MKKAAVMVIIEDGKLLAVTRKGYVGDDPKNNAQVGLPGGKVDDGETFLAAAVRETFEETGLKVDTANVFFADKQVVLGDEDFLVYTFVALHAETEKAKQCEPELYLIWLTPQEFLSRSHAPEHIKVIFDKLGLPYTNKRIKCE